MKYLSFQGMPSFRDPDGSVWVWDAESKTMVKKPAGTEGTPDRGHATGGDNDLFDPFQHTEESGVPELEGYMAAATELIPKNTEVWSPKGKVNCPNCSTSTGDHVCPTCGKDLTPEWNQSQHNEFQDVHPEFDTRNEFISDPDRAPKRNQLHTDDSFPSMNLSHIAPVTSVKNWKTSVFSWL